jgi:hypothetical protein
MKQPDDEQIRAALKRSFPPLNPELARDLWPDVLKKLNARITVPWYDWVLMGLTAGTLLLFPRIIIVFAYHL